MTRQERLRELARLGHRLAAGIENAARGRGVASRLAGLPGTQPGVLGDAWGLGGAAWPPFPLYGQGIYRVRAAVLRLPASQLAGMLPPGLALGAPAGDGLHPMLLFFGRQSDVRPQLSPLPGWNYHEVVVALPDVYAPGGGAFSGPFAFMPRLWLDRLAPVLAGVFGYGYAKTLAHIRVGPDGYLVASETGAVHAEAGFSPAGPVGHPRDFSAWGTVRRLLDQPLLAEPIVGVEIGSVLSLRTQAIRSVTPLRANITLSGGAIPGWDGGAFDATGLDSLPAAFEMESHWRITLPMPRTWLRQALPVSPQPPAASDTVPAPATAWVKPRRRRIAVLGGGVGAMTAVWALTQQSGWQELYDITVYQSGWRLGGKGASGRNAAFGNRIEEHGLHIWAGFYENAFRMMRQVYAELGREPGAPLAQFDDAFKPHELVTLEDRSDGMWRSYTTRTPPAPGLPGEGDPLLPRNPIEYLPRLLKALAKLVPDAGPDQRAALAAAPSRREPAMRASVAAAHAAGHAGSAGATICDDAHAVSAHAAQRGPHRSVQLLSALRLVRAAQAALTKASGTRAPPGRAAQALLLLDLGLATARGMIADGLVFRGFAAADGEEWCDWLRRHGAARQTITSTVVRSTYDYVFGFADGDTSRRALAAGTTTHGLLRLMLTYRGSFFWAMQAGMGDTVFGPLYSVLRRRGVRFEFFHRVLHLGLTDDRRDIDRIDIAVQARPVGPEYVPMVEVSKLDCWPSEPLYDQLQHGDWLRDSGADLEHSDGPCADSLTLRRGVHFDAVVLGISLGGLEPLCGDLIAAAPRWRTMLDKVRTVATLGVQLWFERDLQGLGWTGGQTLATAYAEPLDTWADMAWLLPRETWAGPLRPQSVVYLCGPLGEAAGTGDKATEAAIARSITHDWLAGNAAHLWPEVSRPDGGLDCASLFSPTGGTPQKRFADQYFRANTRGSERYVQSVPGSTRARLRADESGFDNLVVAGDWVRTGIDAGCVEAAAMGGLAAASAISHRAVDIVGGGEAPLAHSVLEHAASRVHAVAQTEAVVVLASLPTAAVRALLPPGLHLGAQTLARDGEATVAFMLAHHRNARINLVPLGKGFRELMLLVPSTSLPGAARRLALPSPFAYVARHILDSPVAAALGRTLYGDRGTLGRFPKPQATCAQVVAAAGEPLLTLNAGPQGETVAARQFVHCAAIEWLLGRPLLGRTPSGAWRLSRVDYGLDQARIQDISVALDVFPALRLRQGDTPWRLQSGGTAVIGAFRIWSETTRSNPAIGLRRRRD